MSQDPNCCWGAPLDQAYLDVAISTLLAVFVALGEHQQLASIQLLQECVSNEAVAEFPNKYSAMMKVASVDLSFMDAL